MSLFFGYEGTSCKDDKSSLTGGTGGNLNIGGNDPFRMVSPPRSDRQQQSRNTLMHMQLSTKMNLSGGSITSSINMDDKILFAPLFASVSHTLIPN